MPPGKQTQSSPRGSTEPATLWRLSPGACVLLAGARFPVDLLNELPNVENKMILMSFLKNEFFHHGSGFELSIIEFNQLDHVSDTRSFVVIAADLNRHDVLLSMCVNTQGSD
jgi:hypothetical protein